MWKKRNQPNSTDWKAIYLELFESTVLVLLQKGINSEDIINWSNNMTLDFNLDCGLVAGIKKYTTVEERQQALIKLG